MKKGTHRIDASLAKSRERGSAVKHFKITLAALLAFALMPLLPNDAWACLNQDGAAVEMTHNRSVFATALRNSGTTASLMGIHAASPAPTSTIEQPFAAKPSNDESFTNATDTIELLHGTFAFTTGVALVIVGVALENNRRN